MAKRGRPPLTDTERLDARLQSRVTETEAELVQFAADLAGVSISEWVRDRVRRAAARELSREKRRG